MRKIITITTFFSTLLLAQNTSYKFDYYDISDGLSQNRAQAIFQAQDGYIYVGSQGGLDRFDGYDFKYYSHNPNDSTSVPDGWVNAIGQDNSGHIWIGTQQKTVGYLKPNGLWERVELEGMKTWDRDGRAWWWGLITDFKFIDNKTLISSFGNGLFIIQNGIEKHYKSEEKNANTISEIYVINNRVFLATMDGLYEFDIEKEEYIKTSISLSTFGFSKSLIDNEVYVSSPSKIYKYNIKSNKYNEIALSISKKKRDFKRMALHNQKLWIVNESYGIVVYDTKNKSSFQISPPSIKDTEHAKLIVDRDNAIWIGTSNYGMMKYDPGKQKFNLYSKDFPSSNPLGFDGAWGATIDNDGNYWTGKAESYGEVVKINRNTGKIKRYLKTNEPRSWFWAFVNTKDGLLVRKAYPGRGETQFFEYKSNTDKFNEVEFTKLFPDTIGGTWGYTADKRTFALTSKGIKIYNGDSFILDTKLNSNFSEDKFPRFDYSVQKNIVYMREPTASKLYKWDTTTDQIKTIYESEIFGQGSAQSFVVYGDSLIYITTYGFGLVEINIEKNTKRFITVSDGLPSQHLYEGYLGNDNNIWTSSNYGIFSFNPLNKSIKSYLVADGLQDFEFNSNSNYQSQDGELMFIGIRGLNYFYPKDIVPKSNPPQVVIQNAVVGDESVNLNTDRIVIPWYDNKVVFDFAALSYRNPSKNQYSYNLDGYDSDWVYSSDNRRFATYTNLPAGDYTFKVKGSNNDGIWNEKGTSINVKVYPPPWQTWWAYLIYIVSIVGLGYSYSKYRERTQLKQMEDERKQSELDAAKDLQESMLPKTTPESKDFSIETFIRSSTEVGGDYYDFFTQEDGSFYSVCGDATGHGTTAGMMVSITKAGLNGIPSLPPNEILNRLNKVVKRVDLGIIRMSLNIVHFKNGTATMANAAMPPIYHYSADKKKVNEIEIVNLPLGGLANEDYELAEIDFNEGDLLVQLSDGLPEAPNPAGELIDYQKLFDCIEQNAMKSPKDVVESLVAMAEEWLDGNINPDDITIVATKKNKTKE